RVLPARSLQGQYILSKYVPVLRRGRGPILPDRTPGIPETFFVRVPVLRNDRGDPVRVPHRQTETCWCAIVEHIDRVAVEFERLREGLDGRRQSIKRVAIFPFRRNLGKSETREIWRDHAVVVGEARNEIAEHER